MEVDGHTRLSPLDRRSFTRADIDRAATAFASPRKRSVCGCTSSPRVLLLALQLLPPTGISPSLARPTRSRERPLATVRERHHGITCLGPINLEYEINFGQGRKSGLSAKGS